MPTPLEILVKPHALSLNCYGFIELPSPGNSNLFSVCVCVCVGGGRLEGEDLFGSAVSAKSAKSANLSQLLLRSF